jgi:Domain of unknown function (DUF4440)
VSCANVIATLKRFKIIAERYRSCRRFGLRFFLIAEELASIDIEPFTMNATEQTVDFAGDAAVVHGLNTVTQSGKLLSRERYTDVFVKQNGSWMALSAQETAI